MTAPRTRVADAVQRAAERAVEQRASSWSLATVSEVHTDGTCTVTTPLGPIVGVRRLTSYRAPKVSDVVKVASSAVGNWVIVGSLATSNPAWQPLTLSGGWAAHASFYTPAARINGDGTASLCGLAQLSGSLAAGTVATLPANTWPAKQVRFPVQVAAGYFGVMTLLTNGEIQLGDFSATLPATGNKWAEFDVVSSYRLV